MKNNTQHINEFFETYIPKATWPSILKVSVKYEKKCWISWLSFLNLYWCRTYSLKVVYKNDKEKMIPITRVSKDIFKAHVMQFNFYLSTL
jgi:hypothetical protein